MTATILSECFPCTGGPIDGATPGPVCGWTFSEAFKPKGGNITFTPGIMSMNTVANNNVPAATKPITLPTLNGITFQTTFTEFSGTPISFTQYEYYLVSAGQAEQLYFRFRDDGTFALTIGPAAGVDIYSATWTPNNGTHVVHITISAGGVPTMYLDGVLFPLNFIFNTPSPAALPGNIVGIFFGGGTSFPDSAGVESVFITPGAVSPTTPFCCT